VQKRQKPDCIHSPPDEWLQDAFLAKQIQSWFVWIR